MSTVSNAVNESPDFSVLLNSRLSESDEKCLEEIQAVVDKYKAHNRFGVFLVHKHYDLEEGEILVEDIDEEKRYQIVKPMRVSEEERKKLVPTVLKFKADKSEPIPFVSYKPGVLHT